jgi:hypothetical protein
MAAGLLLAPGIENALTFNERTEGRFMRFLTLLICTLICAAITGTAVAQDRYPRATWNKYSNSSVNISVYVFRDMNRNGVYDMGDRPMSGIIVDAIGNRRSLTRRSNLSGFANFEMSASNPEKDITFAGKYEFRLAVPPGWRVTTDNEVQISNFELRPGAPADIIALQPPLPVGLAPDLTIAGRLAESTKQSLEAISPSGERLTISTDPHGHFEFAATTGEWRIAIPGADASGRQRLISVGNSPVLLSMIGDTDTGDAGAGRLHTVTFDELQSGSVLKVPSGYGGLDWNNFVMAHQKIYPAQGYRNNLISGEFVAYNGSGHPVSISREAPFDFIGGYVGASNPRAEGETLIVSAWRGEELAYEEAFQMSALGPLYFSAEFKDVTRLEFRTEHYWQVTFDDLTFRLPD